jgi:hypothetical protein
MHIDIRTPVGLMFAAVGLLLVVAGLAGDAAMFERSLGVNINLWWGLVMAGFGALMLWLARRSRAQPVSRS